MVHPKPVKIFIWYHYFAVGDFWIKLVILLYRGEKNVSFLKLKGHYKIAIGVTQNWFIPGRCAH